MKGSKKQMLDAKKIREEQRKQILDSKKPDASY